MAENAYLSIHTDDDFGMSTMIVLSDNMEQLEYDSPILMYMCFPQQGVSVALRHGDILLFNPLIPHGSSSRTSTMNNVITIALYTKTGNIGGNDNTKIINDGLFKYYFNIIKVYFSPHFLLFINVINP